MTFGIHLPPSFTPPDLLYTFNKIFSLSSVSKSPWNVPYWLWTDIASHCFLLFRVLKTMREQGQMTEWGDVAQI